METSMWLTVKDVANRLAVSKASIYQLVQRNHLEHVRIGTGRGTIRIKEESLDAYLKRDVSGETKHKSHTPVAFKHVDFDRIYGSSNESPA
jgi:excisionase family DNA binding protein